MFAAALSYTIRSDARMFSCFSNGKYFRNENKSFFEWFVSDFFVGLFIVNEKAHNSVCISLFFNVLISSILRI